MKIGSMMLTWPWWRSKLGRSRGHLRPRRTQTREAIEALQALWANAILASITPGYRATLQVLGEAGADAVVVALTSASEAAALAAVEQRAPQTL